MKTASLITLAILSLSAATPTVSRGEGPAYLAEADGLIAELQDAKIARDSDKILAIYEKLILLISNYEPTNQVQIATLEYNIHMQHVKNFDFTASRDALNAAWSRLSTNSCSDNQLLGLTHLDRGMYYDVDSRYLDAYECLTNAHHYLALAYGSDDSRLASIERTIKSVKDKSKETQPAPPAGRGEAPRP